MKECINRKQQPKILCDEGPCIVSFLLISYVMSVRRPAKRLTCCTKIRRGPLQLRQVAFFSALPRPDRLTTRFLFDRYKFFFKSENALYIDIKILKMDYTYVLSTVGVFSVTKRFTHWTNLLAFSWKRRLSLNNKQRTNSLEKGKIGSARQNQELQITLLHHVQNHISRDYIDTFLFPSVEHKTTFG